MTDQQSNGKVIFVNGPSFSGKTFVINKLVQHLTSMSYDLSTISFEQIYKSNFGYNALVEKYTNLITKKLSTYKIVICEGTVFNIPFENSLTILIDIPVEQHIKYFEDWTHKFGKHDGMRRIGENVKRYGPVDNINRIRNFFKARYKNDNVNKIVIDNTSELDDLYNLVINYVSS